MGDASSMETISKSSSVIVTSITSRVISRILCSSVFELNALSDSRELQIDRKFRL